MHMCLFEKNFVSIDSHNDQMLGITFADPEMLYCKLLFLWLLTPASSPLQFLVLTTPSVSVNWSCCSQPQKFRTSTMKHIFS